MSAPRILAIRFGALGDLVLATCVIDALAAEYPGCAIEFVTKSEFAPLLDSDPRLARVIRFDGNLMRLLRETRRGRYDAIFDLHDTPRSRVVAWAARADVRRRFDKRSRERRALLARPPRSRPAASPRLRGGVVGWYGEMFGGRALTPRLIVDAHVAAARGLLADAGVGEGFVAIAPFAGRRTKEWPDDATVALVGALQAEGSGGARGAGVALIGGGAERARLEALAREGGAPLLAPPLAALPAILSLASLLVTTDSAPLHVAEAVGTPVVALFGPTVRGFGFAPRDVRSVVVEIEDLECRPCALHGGDACPLGHHRCLREIDPARVAAAVASRLERAARADAGAHRAFA